MLPFSSSVIWPIFSSSVMRASRSATRASTPRLASRYGGGAPCAATSDSASASASAAAARQRRILMSGPFASWRAGRCMPRTRGRPTASSTGRGRSRTARPRRARRPPPAGPNGCSGRSASAAGQRRRSRASKAARADDGLGDRGALAAGQPGAHDRVGEARGVAEDPRAAGVQHQHERVDAGAHALDQRELVRLERQAVAVAHALGVGLLGEDDDPGGRAPTPRPSGSNAMPASGAAAADPGAGWCPG
jgi:hypothetical protein